MICAYCHEKGERSTVFEVDPPKQWGEPPKGARFWDEDGKLHYHDSRRYIARYKCSKGHRWRVERLEACPNRGCPLAETEPRSFIEKG